MTHEDELADAIADAAEKIAGSMPMVNEETVCVDMSDVAAALHGTVIELHHGLDQTRIGLSNVFVSCIERDRHDQGPANVVDGLFAIANAIDGLADTIENATTNRQNAAYRQPDNARPTDS